MRRIMIVGIGAGNPDHITLQAIDALRRADVFFVTDKGDKEDLQQLRREILQRHVPQSAHKVVAIQDPERDRTAADYPGAVGDWHRRRAALYEALFSDSLEEHGCGAFLVWGDPCLYDSTLRIVADIAARGNVAIDYEIIPGITSIQALTARHRIPLNQIGGPVRITTGRRLSQDSMATAAAGPDTSDIVVMLDGACAFKHVTDSEVDIYWGAYLGTPDEILLSGKLSEIAPTIEQTRSRARAQKGWIMDTYLLRKPIG